MGDLHRAAKLGNLEEVKKLIKSGADLDSEDNNGYTPIHIASSEGHLAVVKELIKSGAYLDNEANNGYTPLHIASSEGHLAVVKELLQEGADVDSEDNNGYTPLHIASSQGNVAMVKELLQAGADVDSQDKDGDTPLYIASGQGHLDVVKELIQAGADVDSQDNNGNTPLHIASQEAYLDVVKELLQEGADVDSEDKDGYTPLHIASQEGHLAVVKELLQEGADVDSEDKDGYTPLHIASSEGYIDVVKELLQEGATITKNIYNEASPEMKKIMDDYMPKWKGWTRSDAEKFDTIFSTKPDATGKIPANDFACCPVCLKFVERSEACMYMKHDCSKSEGFYHEDLYNKYKMPDGNIGWCTICGRIATGHRHHIINMPTDPKAALGPDNGDPFERDCSKTNGGGGLPEKLARFRRMREYAFQIQKLLAKGKTFKEEDILKKMVEETWKAPFIDNPLLNNIMTNKNWNIPSSNFPPNMRTDVNEKVANYENVRWPNKNKPEAQPILEASGFNAVGMEDKVPVIRFRHRQPDNGTIYIHKDNERIGTSGLRETIEQYVTNFSLENFGTCFATEHCKGFLYPEELEQFVIKDPANPKGMECLPKEMFDKYKFHFNQKFAKKKGGRRRKTRKLKVKKQKGGGGDFFQPATNAVCDLPKKKGGKRKTRKHK